MPSRSSSRSARTGRGAAWTLLFGLVVLLAQSALWSGQAPIVLVLGILGVGVVSAWRPADGLLLLAGLLPFEYSIITAVWNVYPFDLAQALVLAFMAGYLWHFRRAIVDGLPPDALATPAGLFATIVLASCAVQLVVLQVWHDYPVAYAASFVRYLVSEYLVTVPDPRPWVDGRDFVGVAALMLEGIALVRCARRLCAADPSLRRRVTHMIAAAGAGIAVMSIYFVVGRSWQNHVPVLVTIQSSRWSPPSIPSLDTAGVYFLLVAFAAASLATESRALRLPSVLAVATILAGLALTRTRVAVVAGLGGAAAVAVWIAASRIRSFRASRALAIALGLAVLVGAVVLVFNPFHILAARADVAMRMRVLFAQAGLRMFRTAPFTGVGVGQYGQHYLDFASAEILRYDRRVNNAHNYLLWMAAELGVFGMLAFAWVVATALWQGWSELRSSPRSFWLLVNLMGVIAFVVTWSIGQPIAIPQMAFTFWLLLGAVAIQPTASGTPRSRLPFPARAAVAAVALFAIVSVPARTARAVEDIDLSRVSYGFHNSGATPDGREYRWAGPRITLFQRASVMAVDIPIAAALPSTPHGVVVDVLVDGRAADRVTLGDAAWRTIRIRAPLRAGSKTRFWRIDLQVTPIDLAPGTPDDARRVAIGAIGRIPLAGVQ